MAGAVSDGLVVGGSSSLQRGGACAEQVVAWRRVNVGNLDLIVSRQPPEV